MVITTIGFELNEEEFMNAKFYFCPICKNLVGMVHSSGVVPVCCGAPMKAIEANTVEASREKHLPEVELDVRELAVRMHVRVGSVDHPMEDAHYIEWIFVETEHGGMRRALKPGDKPEATFVIDKSDKAVAVYAYCNLHGLWKTVL